MAWKNLLLKLRNAAGMVINPRREDGHGAAAGGPSYVALVNALGQIANHNQLGDAGNSAFITADIHPNGGHEPGSPFTGPFAVTRARGVKETLTLWTAFKLSTGEPIPDLSMVVTFQGSDNGTDATVTRAVPLPPFNARRLLHTTDWLTNLWEHYRCKMVPSRALVADEAIVISTAHNPETGAKFLYPMDYEFLEAAQTSPVVQSIQKAFDIDGNSVSNRATSVITSNSRTASAPLLAAGATFTPANGFSTLTFKNVTSLVRSNQPGTIAFQVADADIAADYRTISTGPYGGGDVAQGYVFAPISAFSRMLFTNTGPATQTVFRMQTIAHDGALGPILNRLDRTLSGASLAIQTRSVIVAESAITANDFQSVKARVPNDNMQNPGFAIEMLAYNALVNPEGNPANRWERWPGNETYGGRVDVRRMNLETSYNLKSRMFAFIFADGYSPLLDEDASYLYIAEAPEGFNPVQPVARGIRIPKVSGGLGGLGGASPIEANTGFKWSDKSGGTWL